ncbi:lipid droplet-associated hydrolase-like [Anticarsia gemmatalis]|uniref:lipid droplet-associated hydrolase-like n=1 Tax=Anticarsia gemmatalis TaxID=129554 RepID=UPI003F757694
MYVHKNINGIESRLITFGDPFERSGSEVIVVITGSPGIPEFYREFAQELHSCTRLPVCVLGHAGHDTIDKAKHIKPNLYNLDSQIEHKLDFIVKHIDKDSKFHIIGHSIGAWMLVELLNKNDYLIERICSVNLLFPTLQKFSDTTNGKYINNIVRRFPGLMLLLFCVTQWVPAFVRLFLIKLFIISASWPSHYVDRINLYLNPLIQEKSIALACESLERVSELNYKSINKVKHLTNVVYSVEDGWVPMHHIADLKKFEPHITLVEVNVDHAFVLKHSALVGKIVSQLINDKADLK